MFKSYFQANTTRHSRRQTVTQNPRLNNPTRTPQIPLFAPPVPYGSTRRYCSLVKQPSQASSASLFLFDHLNRCLAVKGWLQWIWRKQEETYDHSGENCQRYNAATGDCVGESAVCGSRLQETSNTPRARDHKEYFF